MFDLLKTEMMRYRIWIPVLMAVHLAGWWMAYISQLSLLSASSPVVLIVWIVSVVGGFLFGLLQFGLYKKPSKWAYLIHRPVPSWAIFTSLITAALALLFCTLMLPVLLVTIVVDLSETMPVDLRHYLFAPYVLCLAFAAYLVGAFSQLYPSKGAVLIGSLLSFVIVRSSATTGWAVFIPMAMILAWLLYLTFKAFKPDLSTAFKSKTSLLLTALPMQISLAILLIFASLPLYHLPLFVTGKHPDNHPPEGSYEYFRWHLPVSERGIYITESLSEPLDKQLGEQVKLAEVDYLFIGNTSPKRHQMFYQDRMYILENPDNGNQWIFSHDKMLFKGVEQHTGQSIGWLGKTGFSEQVSEAEAFTDIPLTSRGQYIVLPQEVLQVNFQDRLVYRRHYLQDQERYLPGVNFTEDYAALLSDQSLYIFDRSDFLRQTKSLQPDHTVTHPQDIHTLGQIQTVRLVNGYLITYMGDIYTNPDDIPAITLQASLGQEPRLLKHSVFKEHKHPAIIRYNQFINSAFIDLLTNSAWGMISPNAKAQRTVSVLTNKTVLSSVLWTVVLLSIASAITVLWLSKRARQTKGETIMWTLVALIVGVPGLVTFLLLSQWRKPLD